MLVFVSEMMCVSVMMHVGGIPETGQSRKKKMIVRETTIGKETTFWMLSLNKNNKNKNNSPYSAKPAIVQTRLVSHAIYTLDIKALT